MALRRKSGDGWGPGWGGGGVDSVPADAYDARFLGLQNRHVNLHDDFLVKKGVPDLTMVDHACSTD